MSLEISVFKTTNPKAKPTTDLGFGKYFSDHMFVAEFNSGFGWHKADILPYQNFQIDPGASVLHYGQALFEGMKAFRQKNNQIALFRPEFNYARMQKGAERLCMQMPPKDLFLDGLKQLVKIDSDWVPSHSGSSLYLRPTLIGTEGFLGVRPSEQYKFFIIASPVSSYYKEGLGPVKIWVEENYVRAAHGGLGATKAAANYAGSLKAAFEAKNKGYSQVLWLDVNHDYVEEVGTMNVFFVINNEIHTPALDGTILNGGVRECAIQLLKSNGYAVIERKIKWTEIESAYKDNSLTEAFGTGTAAVITPIGELNRHQKIIDLNQTKNAFKIAHKLYQQITSIQYGNSPDQFNWLVKI